MTPQERAKPLVACWTGARSSMPLAYVSLVTTWPLLHFSQYGLDEIIIGTLATQTHLSKSGVFAHFRSRNELLLAISHPGEPHFRTTGIEPSLAIPPGVARLRVLYTRWLAWARQSGLRGGCPFVAATVDDVPVPIYDDLQRSQRRWLSALTKFIQEAITVSDLGGEVDAVQLAWDLLGILLMHHFAARLLEEAGAHQRALEAFETRIRVAMALEAAR